MTETFDFNGKIRLQRLSKSLHHEFLDILSHRDHLQLPPLKAPTSMCSPIYVATITSSTAPLKAHGLDIVRHHRSTNAPISCTRLTRCLTETALAAQRITAKEALQHPWFKELAGRYHLLNPHSFPTVSSAFSPSSYPLISGHYLC